jgi:hypothetical protein
MGDIADMLFEQGLQEMIDGELNGPPSPVYCKYCKRDGFHWDLTDTGWRLITITGRIHSCKAYRDGR